MAGRVCCWTCCSAARFGVSHGHGITTYLAAFQFQKIRNFSLWQQALIIGLLSWWKITVFCRAPVQPRQPQFRPILVDVDDDVNMALDFMVVLRKVRRRFIIK